MLARDGDLGLFFVIHFEHEAGFEPRNDFLDVVDVDEVGAMGAPEGIVVEGGVEFFEGAVVGGTFGVFGDDGDDTAIDGGEDKVGGIHQKHALLGANKDFCGLGGGGLWRGEQVDEVFQAFRRASFGFDFALDALDGFEQARFVEGF